MAVDLPVSSVDRLKLGEEEGSEAAAAAAASESKKPPLKKMCAGISQVMDERLEGLARDAETGKGFCF